jgi:outer membrane biogenesis lipoprotein LolB
MSKYMLYVFAILLVFLLSSCAGESNAGSSNDAYIWRDDLTTEAEVRAEFARIKADVYAEWTRENEQICQRVLQKIANKVDYDIYGSGAI